MESVIGILEGRNESEKVEVHLTHAGSTEERLDLRLLSWGEGVGWYPQKTMALNCGEIDALQTILKRAKALILTNNRQKLSTRGKRVPFPLRPKNRKAIEKRVLREA